MAYIGKSIESGTFSVLDTSGNTYNGSNTAFNLGTQVGSVAQLLVSHDGVIQKPGTDYTLSSGGTAITFSTAPASGASIFIVEISGAVGGPLDSDLNGTELILDADADTSITADTDDQIDFKTGGTDRLKIDSTDVTVSTGNIVFGTANKGVYLGVTSATASNLLDDYEEGTWTATCVVDGGAMSLNSSFNTGSYVKIGNIVNVQGFFEVNATNASAGFIGIAGLPFASASMSEGAEYSVGSVFVRKTSSAVGGGIVGWIEAGGQSSLALRENGTTAGGNTLTDHFDADTDFTINVTYRTA
jgi:hypothetical protein